jgi:hypothetical protein
VPRGSPSKVAREGLLMTEDEAKEYLGDQWPDKQPGE